MAKEGVCEPPQLEFAVFGGSMYFSRPPMVSGGAGVSHVIFCGI